MIPASVQSTSDATAPFWPYAAHALLFVAALGVFCWLVVDGIPRLFRSWREARFVVNQAEAFCRQAERETQR